MNDILDLLSIRDGRPLIQYRGTTLTRGDFAEHVESVASRLARFGELKAGHFVLIKEDNPLNYYALLFALWKNGNRVVFPHNSLLRGTSSFNQHRHAVMIGAGNVEIAPNDRFADARISPDLGDTIVFSSGSTGNPKGILHHRNNFLRNAQGVSDIFPFRSYASVTLLKPYLVSAFSHFLVHHLTGACLIFSEFDDPSATARIYAERPGLAMVGSPAHFQLSKWQDYATAAPRFFFSSGDYLSPSMISALLKRFPAAWIFKVYGLAEVAGRFFVKPISADTPPAEFEDIGESIRGLSYTVQDNEIFVSSDILFSGYVQAGSFLPAQTPHPTGDICGMAEGRLVLRGRKNDEIKIGGNKIFPRQIENKIGDLFGGGKAVLIASTHPRWGTILSLVIEGGSSRRRRELIPLLRSRLEKHEMPQQYLHIDRFPLTESAKLNRTAVASLLDTLRHVDS